MKLTKNELIFIQLATTNCDGVFDFENVTEKEWEHTYGMTYAESIMVLEDLRNKVNKILKPHWKSFTEKVIPTQQETDNWDQEMDN